MLVCPGQEATPETVRKCIVPGHAFATYLIHLQLVHNTSGNSVMSHITQNHSESQNSWGQKGPLQVMWSNTTFRYQISKNMTPHLFWIAHASALSFTKHSSVYWCAEKTSRVCVHYLLHRHWASLTKAWIHLLYTLSSSIYGHGWDPLEPPLLQMELFQLSALSTPPERRGSPGLEASWWLYTGLFPECQCPSCSKEPSTGLGLQLQPHQHWAERKDHLLWCAGDILPNAAKNTFSLLSSNNILLTHLFNSVFTKTSRSFSAFS